MCLPFPSGIVALGRSSSFQIQCLQYFTGQIKGRTTQLKKAGWFIASYILFAPTVSEFSGCLVAIQVADSWNLLLLRVKFHELKEAPHPCKFICLEAVFSAFLACTSKLESCAWIGEQIPFLVLFSWGAVKSNVNGQNAQGEAKICSRTGAGLVYK